MNFILDTCAKLLGFNRKLNDSNSVKTNIGRVSDDTLREHIKLGQAFLIDGKLIIDTSSDLELYHKLMKK